jgi:hypothetical protein
MMKNKFYKVYNDYVVRDSINGNIDFDTDVLTVIEMVEYDQMGIEIAHWNKAEAGNDILYRSKPFELEIHDNYKLIEIVEQKEPANYRGRDFYKEVTYKLCDEKGVVSNFRIDHKLAWDHLPKSWDNTHPWGKDFFLVNPFKPITYERMGEHLLAIHTSLIMESLRT